LIEEALGMQALFKNKGGGWKYLILDGKIECSSDG